MGSKELGVFTLQGGTAAIGALPPFLVYIALGFAPFVFAKELLSESELLALQAAVHSDCSPKERLCHRLSY